MTILEMPVAATVSQDESSVPGYRGFETFEMLGVPIAALSMSSAIAILMNWLETCVKPRLVTFTNVHMLTEGRQSPSFLENLRHTDLNCPDGMPLVWFGKHKKKVVSRVCGPELMPALCACTATAGYRHFFYGGRPGIAERVISALRAANPSLQIAGHFSPPFGAIERDEDERVVQLINQARPDIVWVCLGCPKQEIWLMEHRERLNARLLLAVGMAFDVIAGKTKRAPSFLRKVGMEWLFRLMTEPRRLGWRYVRTNSIFLYAVIKDELVNYLFPARSLTKHRRASRLAQHQ